LPKQHHGQDLKWNPRGGQPCRLWFSFQIWRRIGCTPKYCWV